jgi:vacuolar-type H+-ATPase subunit I/STV1
MSLSECEIVDAYYFDEKFSTIQVLIKGADGKTYPRVIPSNLKENDPDRLALDAAGFDKVSLVETTATFRKNQSLVYNSNIDLSVQHQLEKQLEKERQEISVQQQIVKESLNINDDMFDALLSNNSNKEVLFQLKLWALGKELDIDKKVKSKIRKAKSLFEIFSFMNDALEEK